MRANNSKSIIKWFIKSESKIDLGNYQDHLIDPDLNQHFDLSSDSVEPTRF